MPFSDWLRYSLSILLYIVSNPLLLVCRLLTKWQPLLCVFERLTDAYPLLRGYASVNSSSAHPLPSNCGTFAYVVSPGGGAIAILLRPGDWAFAYTRVFESTMDEFIGKDEALCRTMACSSAGTRQNCRCF